MAMFYEITNQEYEFTEHGYCVECQKVPLPPRKTKYCSKKCRDIAIKKSQNRFINEQKTCVCVRCEKEFQYEKHKSSVYCSKECERQTAYEKNRSDFGKKRVTEDLRTDGKIGRDWLPACALPLKVMRIVEAEADNNFVWEDIQEIDKIIAEELPIARYADGTVYVSEVGYDELRRQRAHEQIMMDKGFGRRSRHGKRKEFMASVKNQPNTDTSTEN
jgi:hypothetical protein